MFYYYDKTTKTLSLNYLSIVLYDTSTKRQICTFMFIECLSCSSPIYFQFPLKAPSHSSRIDTPVSSPMSTVPSLTPCFFPLLELLRPLV